MPRPAPSATAATAGGVAATLAVWSAWQADSLLSALAVDRPAPSDGLARLLAPAARWMQPALAGALGALAAALPSAPADAVGPELRELHNKLVVFDRFRFPPRHLRRAVVGELARGAAPGDRWQTLWAFEGLAFRRGRRLGRLDRGRLPAWCSIPLHAGLGLACAVDALDGLEAAGGPPAVGAAIDRFEQQCRRHCRREHLEIALDTLGFAARNLHPRALYPIDRVLRRRRSHLRPHFWHGAGRGLYFAPSQILCASAATAVERLRAEAPDRASRSSALAGWAWAMTLVNVRHPGVVRHHLDRRWDDAWVGAALARGKAAGLDVWKAVEGRPPALPGGR